MTADKPPWLKIAWDQSLKDFGAFQLQAKSAIAEAWLPDAGQVVASAVNLTDQVIDQKEKFPEQWPKIRADWLPGLKAHVADVQSEVGKRLFPVMLRAQRLNNTELLKVTGELNEGLIKMGNIGKLGIAALTLAGAAAASYYLNRGSGTPVQQQAAMQPGDNRNPNSVSV